MMGGRHGNNNEKTILSQRQKNAKLFCNLFDDSDFETNDELSDDVCTFTFISLFFFPIFFFSLFSFCHLLSSAVAGIKSVRPDQFHAIQYKTKEKKNKKQKKTKKKIARVFF